MILGNIEIHGATQAIKNEDGGYSFLRVPDFVDTVLGNQGKLMNRGSTGIEFRFMIKESVNEVKLTFRNSAGTDYNQLLLYYGDFAADWPETYKITRATDTEVIIHRPANIDILRSVAKEYSHRFSPDVIRIFISGMVTLQKTDENIIPPTADAVPDKRYLAYGSSITHGSIALERPYEFVNRIGEELGYDTYNLGFAGSALLEPEMAKYIATVPFDIATLEMGINILSIEPSDYENRVRTFIPIIANAHPDAKIFAIDVFYCNDDYCNHDNGNGKAAVFREILHRVVSELALPNVIYVNGLSILPDAKYLTTGMVHPGPRGIMQITERLVSVIQKHM